MELNELITSWYDITEDAQTLVERLTGRLSQLDESSERLKDFLLSTERKPKLKDLLDEFLEWCQRHPKMPRFQGSYDDYIRSDEWKQRRRLHLKLAENRCQLCYSDGNLHVHHRTYERLGCETFTDLIALCRKCHAIFHGKIKPPLSQEEEVQKLRRVVTHLKDEIKADEWKRTAAILQGESDYTNELALLCKVCKDNHVYPIEVRVTPFKGRSGGHGEECIITNHGLVTRTVDIPLQQRGVHITLRFECESGCLFEHHLSFHKGYTHIDSQRFSIPALGEDQLLVHLADVIWRD